MKIAVVCTQYGPHGGTGRVTTEVFERFARDGHHVDVFCGKHEKGINYEVSSITDLGLRAKGIFLQLEMLYRATKRVRPEDYDILYATGDYHKSPDVVTIHSLASLQRRAREGLEASGHIERAGLAKRLARKIYMPWIFELGEKVCYPNRDPLYVAVSNGTARDFADEFHNGSMDRIRVVENGVDPTRFYRNDENRKELRKKYSIDEDAPVALFAGSDWGRKRIDVALAAVGRVPGLKLVVVGRDDPSKYWRYVEKAGCEDRVVFVGFTTEIEAFYSMADYFLFPTAYETFGLVALEAMSCGCVVLASPVNGCVDFIRNGENGFLCDFGDVGAYENRLEIAMSDPSLRNRIAVAARATAEQMSWENVYRRYRGVFEEAFLSKTAKGER